MFNVWTVLLSYVTEELMWLFNIERDLLRLHIPAPGEITATGENRMFGSNFDLLQEIPSYSILLFWINNMYCLDIICSKMDLFNTQARAELV